MPYFDHTFVFPSKGVYFVSLGGIGELGSHLVGWISPLFGQRIDPTGRYMDEPGFLKDIHKRVNL